MFYQLFQSAKTEAEFNELLELTFTEHERKMFAVVGQFVERDELRDRRLAARRAADRQGDLRSHACSRCRDSGFRLINHHAHDDTATVRCGQRKT